MARYSLPHGAKVFEGEGFAVYFGADKTVFIPKPRADGQPIEHAPEMHYTFHAGPESGVVDLHQTTTASDGQKHHRTLFAMRTSDLPPVLQQLAPMLGDLLGLLRPLRLGWMMHRGIGIARGVDPMSDQEFAAVSRAIKIRGKTRLTIDEQLYRQNICVPEYLEEVYEFPDGPFTMFHGQRKIGFGFKATDPEGNVRLFWIKRRDLLHFGKNWQQKVVDTLRLAALPPESYADYFFFGPE